MVIVLIVPPGVNAFAYIVLARMIHFFIPSHRVFHIPAIALAATFVALDIISFVIQLVGGGMATPTASTAQQQKGINIYMGGIGYCNKRLLSCSPFWPSDSTRSDWHLTERKPDRRSHGSRCYTQCMRL